LSQEVPAVIDYPKGEKQVEVLTNESVTQVNQAVAILREQAEAVPKDQRIEIEVDITDEQAVLLEALGLLLKNWYNQEAAQSVDIDLGVPILRQLKEGESLILTVCNRKVIDEATGCTPEFQVEIKRLAEITPVPKYKILSCHMNTINGRPYCCATLSEP
jgi:hypothetical protein